MCVCDFLGESFQYSMHRLSGLCTAVMKYQWNEKEGEIRLVSAVLGSDVSDVIVAVREFRPS